MSSVYRSAIGISLCIALCLGLTACEPERGPRPGVEPPVLPPLPVEVAPPTESSRAMLEKFYTYHLRNQDSGVPDDYRMDLYRPYLSQRLIALMERARRHRAQAIAARPDEKPPFVDGDLFSSLFEGPTGFAIGKPIRLNDDNQRVPIVFSNVVRGEKPVRWTDYAVMVHEETGWKLDDIEYGGQWAFAQQGRLSDALQP
jgi:hypothetical protein